MPPARSPSFVRSNRRAVRLVLICGLLGSSLGAVAHFSELEGPRSGPLAMGIAGPEAGELRQDARSARRGAEGASGISRGESGGWRVALAAGSEITGAPAPDEHQDHEGPGRSGRLTGLLCGQPAERISRAHEILAGGAGGALGARALDVLVELDPQAAVGTLHRLAAHPTDGRLAITSERLRQLGRRQSVLPNADLIALYGTGTREVRAVAARALAERGDDSLARTFIEECAPLVASADEATRRGALKALQKLRSSATCELLFTHLHGAGD